MFLAIDGQPISTALYRKLTESATIESNEPLVLLQKPNIDGQFPIFEIENCKCFFMGWHTKEWFKNWPEEKQEERER